MTSNKLCACGCGLFTQIARIGNPKHGTKRGDPNVYVHGHGAKGHGRPPSIRVKRYRTVQTENGRMLLHRARAEKALGKPLPPGALVHHADGSKRDDAPLVICPDDAYHQLLHARMRVKVAGGNPNTDLICSKCRGVKDKTLFHRTTRTHSGFSRWCRACYSAYHRDYLLRKRMAS